MIDLYIFTTNILAISFLNMIKSWNCCGFLQYYYLAQTVKSVLKSSPHLQTCFWNLLGNFLLFLHFRFPQLFQNNRVSHHVVFTLAKPVFLTEEDVVLFYIVLTFLILHYVTHLPKIRHWWTTRFLKEGLYYSHKPITYYLT